MACTIAVIAKKQIALRAEFLDALSSFLTTPHAHARLHCCLPHFRRLLVTLKLLCNRLHFALHLLDDFLELSASLNERAYTTHNTQRVLESSIKLSFVFGLNHCFALFQHAWQKRIHVGTGCCGFLCCSQRCSTRGKLALTVRKIDCFTQERVQLRDKLLRMGDETLRVFALHALEQAL
jgi:hypothetical protein